MRNQVAAALLLIGVSIPARAGVVVLANRTSRDITFTTAGSAQQTVAPFEQAVLYVDGRVSVSYASGKAQRTYRLEPDTAYFFADLPDGVAISGIGAAGGEDKPVDFAPAKSEGTLLKPPPVETIPIRILVDEEEPAARPVWEARLRKRVAGASDVLERTCRVRFEVASAGNWESDNKALDLPALLTDFEHKVPRGDTRLSIGFTSQRTPEGAGIVHLGGTRVPLHPYILMREWTPPTEPGRLEVLLHELGHYLGAVHSPETTSVMRPRLGDGRSVSLRFPVGFDPLNTLAMNLIASEVRSRRVRSLAQLSAPTKDRLRRIYREVQTAIPDDPTPDKFLTLLGPPPVKPEPPPAPRASELEDNARIIVAGIVKAAERNRTLPDRATPGTAPPFRRSGDALTEYYFREAAVVARDLPQGEAAPAYLVGLAIALDTADLFRRNPVTGGLWRRIESDEDRHRRLKVLGVPTMYDRHDSCQHFVDSAALVVVSGPLAAEAAGVLKELLDSQKGGSGFSFADLGSDLSGVTFGQELLAEPGLLLRLANSFAVADYALPPDGLVEGLTYQEFASRFGSVADRRFMQEQQKLRKRIRDLPAYSPVPAPRPPEKTAPANPAPAMPPPVVNPQDEPAPENKAPEQKPLEKTVPAPVAPEPSPEQKPQAPVSPHSEFKIPRSALAFAGLGVLALAGAFYAIWPRRPAPGREQAVRTPVFSGAVLSLAGLALLGAAYARWSTANDEPEAAAAFVDSDLDPAWGEAPLDPFGIPKLRAIRIPTFPGAAAVWGATGRDGHGHIWFGVSAGGEVEPSAHLMEYNPDADAVTDRGDVLAVLHSQGLLHPGESQSTIRTRIVQATDGYLYFASTDEEDTANTDARLVARGSHLWRLRPPDGKWEHLLAVPEKLVAIAYGGQYVYVLGYPDHVLYGYDRTTGKIRSTRVGSVEGHFSSNVLADKRGHAYVPRLRRAPAGLVATLVELNRDLEEIAETPLDPPGQAERDDLHGLVAAQPLADHSVAFITAGGFLYRIVPGEGDRPAKVSALGAFHPRKETNIVALFSPEGERYLMGLDRRQTSFRGGTYEWVVCDLRTGRPVVVPVSSPEEDGRPLKDLLLSGCMTRDDQGCFYLGGSHNRNGVVHPVLLQVRLPH
jgi:hypothetical protein